MGAVAVELISPVLGGSPELLPALAAKVSNREPVASYLAHRQFCLVYKVS